MTGLFPLWIALATGVAAAALPAAWRLALDILARGEYTPSLAGLAANAADSARTLVTAALVVGPAFLAGDLVWPWLAPGGRRLRAAAALPLGVAATGFALYGLLLGGLWFPAVLWALPAALVATRWRSGLSRLAGAWRARPAPDGPWIAALIVGAAGLPWLLLPETHDDAWVYHLAAPERWLAAHGLAMRGAETRTHLPMLADLVHAYPLLLGADAACRWIHALGFLSGAAGFLTVLGGRSPGWALLAVGLSAPCAILLTGKCDGTAAGLVLLAWAAAARRPGAPGALAASGTLAGLALAVKLSSVLTLSWIPLALPAGALLARPARLAGWAAAALAGWAAWGVKSWLLTGDPAYYLLAGHVPGLVDGWDARNAELWLRWRNVAPWSPARPAAALAEVVALAPLFAALLPAALVRPGSHRRIVIAAAGSYVAWGALVHNQHFHRLAFAGLVPAMLAAGAAGVPGARRWPWIGVATVAAAVRLAAQVTVTGWYANPVTWLLGAETRDVQVARAFTRLDEARRALAAAPPGRAIVLVGEQRTYRLPGPAWIALHDAGSQTPLIWDLAGRCRNADDMRKAWRRMNADRLLYNPVRAQASGVTYGMFVWDARRLAVWRDFVERWLLLEIRPARVDLQHGTAYGWRLRSRPLARAPSGLLLFLPGTEALLERSLIAAEAGDLAAGARAWADVGRRAPGVAYYLSERAFFERLAGRPEAAYRLYRPAVDAGLLVEENLSGCGIAAIQTGRYAEAADLFDRAGAAYPHWEHQVGEYAAGARFLLAAERLAGDPAAAERMAREWLDRRPPSRRPDWIAGAFHAVHAAALLAQGRPERAAEALREAGRQIPNIAGLSPPALPRVLELLAREVLAGTAN